MLDQIVDVLGGQSGQYETVVPTLRQILALLGGVTTDIEALLDLVRGNIKEISDWDALAEIVAHTVKIMANEKVFDLESRGLRQQGTAFAAYEGWRAHAQKGCSRSLVERCDAWFQGLEAECSKRKLS